MEQPSTPRREAGARLLDRLTPPSIAGFAVLISIAGKSLTERLSDLDIWWHVKTGELIVATRSIPANDPYSFTAPGRRWIIQEWGSEVILHGINSAFGLRGLILWRALMLLLIYGLFARLVTREAGNRVGIWALIALASYVGALSWTERPNLFSFLLFVVTLTLVRRGGTAIWWFVPIALLWANLHGMVVLGIGLVALVAALEGLKVFFRWDGADAAWAKRLALVAAAGAAASFVNPYGPGLPAHALRLVRIVSTVVTEWASPDFHELVPILFLALVVLAVAGMALGSRRVDPTDVGLAAAFLYLGLYAVRNLPVAGIVLGAVAARYLPAAVAEALERRRATRRADVAVGSATALNVVLAAVVASVFALIIGASFPRSGSLRATIEPRFPLATIESLEGQGIRLFTTDVWAGLVLYMRWPEVHVAFDTRIDFYGNKIIGEYQDVVSASPDWEERLRDWCVTHVLIPESRPLATVLGADSDWTLVRGDRIKRDRALVFRPVAAPTGC